MLLLITSVHSKPAEITQLANLFNAKTPRNFPKRLRSSPGCGTASGTCTHLTPASRGSSHLWGKICLQPTAPRGSHAGVRLLHPMGHVQVSTLYSSRRGQLYKSYIKACVHIGFCNILGILIILFTEQIVALVCTTY